MNVIEHLYIMTRISLILSLVLCGCATAKVERTLKVIDTESGRPLLGATLVLTHDTERLDKPIEELMIPLNAQGEARFRIPLLPWWARVEVKGEPYGTDLLPHSIKAGGNLRLFARPPTPTDTNIYQSKFLLQISVD